jgi:rhamnosyltransferase
MKLCLICPLYNAEKSLPFLLDSISKQKLNYPIELFFLLTESKDNTEQILKEKKVNFIKFPKESFSHSLTREKALFNCKADIAIMITQDIVIKDNFAFSKLIQPIINKEAKYAYGRQLCTNNSIEKYTRELNYPETSHIYSSKNIKSHGIRTFFASDTFSAYDVNFFKEINGFDNLNLPTNEDMYYAHKLITTGQNVAYVADAVVIHSHSYSLRQLEKRYFLFGKFFGMLPIFKTYKSNSAGLSLAFYCFKRALSEFNIKVVFSLLPNFVARYIGQKKGERSVKLEKLQS